MATVTTGHVEQVDKKVVVRSVSMYPSDWDLAQEMAEEFGSNVSHVIRYAVRELHGVRTLQKLTPEVEADRVLLR